MIENENNKLRQLVEFKDGCRYGRFEKTKAYELIAHDRIRAYKMGGKAMIDLDSVDEYHASMPEDRNESKLSPPVCAARRPAHRRGQVRRLRAASARLR
ncbi:hypothetical protein J2R96_004832 [Bradyrhizobium elkanii]|nr:hypothetical protein [Bradyrhizobium elkanii]